MNPADEIRAMVELLREEGWEPHGWGSSETGPRCVVNAFDRALSANTQVAAMAFLSAVRRLFPDRVYLCGHMSCCLPIGEFNDHPDTTFEDIELVAKHAINDLELGEA